MKLVISTVLALLALTACEKPADVASRNLSTAADNFEITRRVVFFNGITDAYLLSIEGRCSLGNNDSARTLTVTCRDGVGSYKKHFLGLSDNVSYFVEQMQPADASVYHYRVMFRPRQILPNIEVDVNGKQ